MLFCYISIINTVKRGNALSAEGNLSDRQRKIERDVTIVSRHCSQLMCWLSDFRRLIQVVCYLLQVSIVICTAFILAWSPYAVVSMWSAWGFHVPNLTSIFTRLFAKSASFYNPLIYFGLSSKFRKDVAVLLPCTKNAKDTVRLKRFKLKADAQGQAAVGGEARLKAHLNQTERKNKPVKEPQHDPRSDCRMASPPPTNKEVFYMDIVPPCDTGPEFECERF